MALGQQEPVTWTNDLIAATKVWLNGSGSSPDFLATARIEIEDLHWAILSGIARAGPVGSPIRQTGDSSGNWDGREPRPAAQIAAPHSRELIAPRDGGESNLHRD